MVNVLVIAILIIPWLIIPFNHLPDPTRLIKAAFFDMTLFGIIVMALKNGLKFEYRNKYLAYFSAWVFLTLAFNWYYPLDRGIGYNADILDSMVHYTLSVVATILVCSSFERIDFIRCAKAMCISATLVSIFCILQSIKIGGIDLDPMKHLAVYQWKESRHIAALLDNPDIAGNYLCMIFPLFLYFNKPKYYICLALCVVALVLIKSSISIVAAFVGLFVYLFLRFARSRKIILGLILAQVMFAVFCFVTPSFNKTDTGFTGRAYAWKLMLERANNPLFGQGLGAVKELQVKVTNNFWMFAHNDYIEIYCALGVLGLFLFSLIVVNAFKRFNYKEDNQIGFAFFGCFVCFLIVMCGSFPMEMPPVALNGLIFFWAMSKT